jgi:hypothetical protein
LEIFEAAIDGRHFTFIEHPEKFTNRSNLMTQSFWFFGSRLNIIADHTTTSGQYDLIEGYFPSGTQTPLHRHTR